MSARRALSCIAVACVLAGCGAQDPARDFTVGTHRVSAAVPPGWDVIDQGRQIRLRKGSAELVLRDLGPAGPRGVRREVERARDLWSAGQGGAALARMGIVPVPRDLFPTPEAGRAFWKAWSRVSQAPAETLYTDLAPAFDEVLDLVDAMPERDLPALVDSGLATLGHDQRRDVKSRAAASIDGREALDVETWNRLTHAGLQRLLFVLNDGSLLALYTGHDPNRDTVKAFEALGARLHFDAGAPRR